MKLSTRQIHSKGGSTTQTYVKHAISVQQRRKKYILQRNFITWLPWGRVIG